MSMRMAASSCSSHSRATLGPDWPIAPDVDAAGRSNTSMTKSVDVSLNPRGMLDTLLLLRANTGDVLQYDAHRPNARENARQQCG